jgi:excisionase family DNA binding protein
MEDIAARLDRLERATALAKNVLTVDEVAMLTGYTVKYLRLLISQHQLSYYRRGNRLFFCRAEVENWMMGQRIPSNEEIQQQANRHSGNGKFFHR